jgi:hypothetical protein
MKTESRKFTKNSFRSTSRGNPLKSDRLARTNGSDPTQASSRPKYSQPEELPGDESDATNHHRIMSAGKNESRILLSGYRNRVTESTGTQNSLRESLDSIRSNMLLKSSHNRF